MGRMKHNLEEAREGDLWIRRMGEEDLPLMVRWRNEPHVRRWWEMDEDPVPFTLAEARAEFDPQDPAVPGIITVGDRPVGYVQWYRWADYADGASEMGMPDDGAAFGLDIFVGEPDLIGTGVGTRTVRLVCDELFANHGASRVALLTAIGNEQAQRAYEKAGLRKVRTALDTDVKDGRRVKSWLMVRERE